MFNLNSRIFPILITVTFVIIAFGTSQRFDEDFHTICSRRCPFQNQSEEHFDIGCGNECKIGQCSKGCLLWREALESSCQIVCNGTQHMISQKELHCVMGCNDAIDQYFQKLKDEIGIPPAPYLVADTLTATSLSLAWEGTRYSEISYLVQWRYEEHAGAWQYCRNQSWGPSSVAIVDNLLPYTKYRFRVALLLSPHSEPIVSEPSVVISTLPSGLPSSAPVILRATAVDSKRISISWKPGPFPNGPIHSYILELVGEFIALKEDIEATKTKDFYMFQNLNANTKYIVSVSMRNAVGEGPPATVEVQTPPEPSVKSIPQPTLILGSDRRVIKQGADMMLDAPEVIYESFSQITGIAIHVNKNLLFVSDSEGYVSVSSLERYSKPKRLLSPADITFKPHDLSVDWLNQHLYILGESNHEKVTFWQVARSSLSGTGVTVAVSGLINKPLHVEVDPYNGYLFWLIQGYNRGGLYRLDLANISNGIKHEVIPDVILEDPHLGAFVVDHINFCVLVPNHAKNTVYSVSLDGREVVDIRSNTQQPLFQNVLSLASANGLFYWTDGGEVLAEDYHEDYHTYFHNHYLASKNRSYIGVFVDLPTSQPVPVPVNPPVQVQAVLGGHVAKISWRPPHIVGGQGKGAWQNWFYEVQVRNEKTGEIITRKGINNTAYYAIDGLQDDTNYLIKAAAYTSSGNGPWSSEFRGKTLKTPENGIYPSILWSASEGLVESDVTGEEVEVLISQENMKENNRDYHFIGVSWYQDTLYLVSNTSNVYWFNVTNHDYGRLWNLESVGSIAIDWIGKKLYWSNPKQQLIIRGDLSGSSPEPLLILTIAKELNIDSQNAFIYWSTGHTVECARLNGDSRRVYYPAELFSGKQVMGLTLNEDEKHVYWIVRSNEGSSLYKAPMAHSRHEYDDDEQPLKISTFKHPNMQGPLCYFGDHLLWLQDNRKAVIGDLSGQNTALVSGMSLSGLNTVAVLDRNKRFLDGGAQVIPEAVNASSIHIIGTSSSFNITWDPVKNVNFGQVFYEIKTESRDKEIILKVPRNVFCFEQARDLPPYSEIKVTIQAFTYWGLSPQIVKKIRSPPSLPSRPLNPRVFIKIYQNTTTREEMIEALLRWDPPDHPNGVITAYRVRYFFRIKEEELDFELDVDPDKVELTITQLQSKFIYYFQVKAFTIVGGGEFTTPIEADGSVETPVPTLVLTSKDSIKIVDCDNSNETILLRGSNPTDITVNSNEGWVYWLNDFQELYGIRLNGTQKTKFLVLNGTGISLTLDWVGRFLYWSEFEEKDLNSGSSIIYRLDLTQAENGALKVEKIIERSGKVVDLEISPFLKIIFWIEVDLEGRSHFMESSIDEINSQRHFSAKKVGLESHCASSEFPVTGKVFSLDQTNPNKIIIVYVAQKDSVYQAIWEECNPILMFRSSTLPATSIATDHRFLFWSNQTENSIYIKEDKENSEMKRLNIEGVNKILALGHHLQPLPPSKCFLVNQTALFPIHFDSTATTITLLLPKIERHPTCQNLSLPSVKYTIFYNIESKVGESECRQNFSKCKSIFTFQDTVTIDGLEPFSNYVFMISVKSYPTFLQKEIVGTPVSYHTLAGAPPSPANVTGTVLSPTSVEIKWAPLKDSFKKIISYQLHWRTEGTVAGVRQSGEQVVENMETGKDKQSRSFIRKLIPGQTYLIWVRTFSKHSLMYGESESVEMRTFDQPENISLARVTPYSLEILWTHPKEAVSEKSYIEFNKISMTENWKKVLVKNHQNNSYFIDNLSPKTFYGFRAIIYYQNSNEAYIWPQDGAFFFETLGDRPGRPGTPIIQHLRKDVYQVLWEKSPNNGAAVDYYILEGLIQKAWRRKRNTNMTAVYDESNNIILREEWIPYYNGTENYWIMNELSASLKYVFRVKAKNKFGWSDFSEISKSFDFTEAAMLAEQQELGLVLSTTLPALLLCSLLVITIFCCVSKIRHKEKKDLQTLNLNSSNRGLGQTDVELATLRELPRRGNFIHNANILYGTSIGSPTNEEIAMLPHIRREQFKLTKFLGSGAFGEVYEGVARGLFSTLEETKVAIKALRKGATEQEKAEFLKEAQLMSHFKHKHILQLVGVCLDNDPNYIIMELMEGGDLLSYLRTNRPLMNTNISIKLQDLFEICVDVTKGCRYLEEMHFVHRDLACRNCLVSSTDPATRVVKIGDFGLARDIYKNDYYRKEGEGLLPVRWMAPESLVDGVFTSQSDVWAFGVLIWEIMTLGQQPYPARTNLEVLHYVRTGGRLGCPNDCPRDLYKLMTSCWSFNPENRPTFKHCLRVLESIQNRILEVSQTDENHVDEGVGRNHISDSGIVSNCGNEEDFENKWEEKEQSLRSNSPTTGQTHKYLELVYDNETIESDGYEIPRVPSSNIFSHKECDRTFLSAPFANQSYSEPFHLSLSPPSYLKIKSSNSTEILFPDSHILSRQRINSEPPSYISNVL